MNTNVYKHCVCIRSVMQFYQRHPDKNISLSVAENFSQKLFPDVIGNFHRFFDILLRFSRQVRRRDILQNSAKFSNEKFNSLQNKVV